MNKKQRVALIGSGPSSLYLLQNMLRKRSELGDSIGEITVFESESEMGVGMPYSRKNTDRFNICNISSEEIPCLDVTFADWLESREVEELALLGIEGPICAKETYPRIALGAYFGAQWRDVCAKLESTGIEVVERRQHRVLDIVDDSAMGAVWLTTNQAGRLSFDRIVIATGHRWENRDDPNSGYFASPWPMQKLIPQEGKFLSFEIGTLGASLSAFDVVTSLAHRHGRFVKSGKEHRFEPHPNCGEFKIVMHSANGWLPHLQYEQREPFRDIYRHVSRDELLALVNHQGFIRLADYFDKVCRPTLIIAFNRDERPDIVDLLRDPQFKLKNFVEQMTSEHDYRDAFVGMQAEMVEAESSLENERPVHWKEVLDDLIYTLNFHAERLAAEDHLELHTVVMPFLMNVIASLPLESARILLSLHFAGRLELIEGNVESVNAKSGETVVRVEQAGKKTAYHYKIFVDCSGQQALDLKDFSFPSLVDSGSVRSFKAKFARSVANSDLPDEVREHVIEDGDAQALELGGVDIDVSHRVIDKNGEVNARIYEIAFPHIAGIRPYSYGLQACNQMASIVIDSWCQEIASPSGRLLASAR